MKKAYYKCIRCGEIKGPFIIQNGQKPTFGQCNSCQYNGQFILEKQADQESRGHFWL